jgi:NAD(P)-dependent dehydrogenase (short-subunit alcohol dehydrogenase family)
MEVLTTTTLDADPEVDRLRTEVHPRHRIAVVPATRNEWLDRKSKLWSLVQSVDPATADLTAVTEEKAAVDAFNGTRDETISLQRRKKMVSTAANIFGATSTTEDILSGIDLRGKRILVTGVSAGLGVETARSLAAHGAQVIGAARDLAKAEIATAQVRKDATVGGGRFELVELDLASLRNVRACADGLLAKGESLDAIIANAGVMATPFGHTADGFETQFGTNHLGHFVLVNRIAPLIRKGGRLINLASAGHRFSNVDLEDPDFVRTPYDPWVAYGRSKTANILFAVAFDRRHRGNGIRAAAVHPGAVRTELNRHLDPIHIQKMIEQTNEQRAPEGKAPLQLKTIPQGAATSVWAAVVAPADEVGGQYCENCHAGKIVPDDVTITAVSEGVRSYALDPKDAEALWKKSEEMVGEKF